MSIKVYSYQIADSIDIKEFKSVFTAAIYHADSDEMFYQVDEAKLLYVFKYGIVCFLNYDETETTAFIQLITPFCKNLFQDRLNEEFEIETNASKINFGFNKIELVKPDIEMFRLIMLNVSQSVALDHYLKQTNILLEETNAHTQMMEMKGRLNLSGINLKKYIGRTLNLKNRITENLYIFDSPDETWEDENLSRLDQDLRRLLISRQDLEQSRKDWEL
jgi:uncharacterized Rmd1/YagE family protein